MNKFNQNYLDFGNLYNALRKCCSGVRWKTSVTQYEINGLKNTAKLIRDVKNNKYKLSPYQEFEIYEPKKRHITATRIKDRHLQRSLCDNYFYPEITKSFILDNAACQICKGTAFAVNRLKKHLQDFCRTHKNGYALKCDIHHFFESLNHTICKQEINSRISDKSVKLHINEIIDSFGENGLGLGSQVSQLLALMYLDKLDHIIKEQLHIKYYIRYMDDFILIHEDREYLKYCLNVIQEYLETIKLTLNSKTSINNINRGFIFLNWKYNVSKTGKVYLTQLTKNLNRKRRKLKKLAKLVTKGKITIEEYEQSKNGIIAHLANGNTYKIRKQLENI